MNIFNLLKQPAGTVIDHVFGRLVSVGDREQKTRPDGEEYTSQDFLLVDNTERGALLSGTVYDHYPLDNKVNQILFFCSMKSRNGRFGGVKVAKLAPESIFSRKPDNTIIRVSKAGAIHTEDSFTLLKRKISET